MNLANNNVETETGFCDLEIYQEAVASLRMVTPGADFCDVTLYNV